MRRLTFLFLLLSCSFAFGQKKAKLSPLTQIYLQKTGQTRAVLPEYVYKKGADGTLYLSALALVDNNNSPQEGLNALGVKTGTKAGKIWTLQIPVDRIKDMVNVAGIIYLQLDEPVHSNLDSARRVTHVDSVHAGLGNLPQSYFGDNVVVGIIDAGFDYRHPSLFDTSGNIYRVKKVWEQLGTGTPPSGFAYGSEMTNPADMWTKGYDLQLMSHGAHVAGIAAGSGYGSSQGTRFRGMAPASDLVLVGITPPEDNWTSTGMSDIIDGMKYVYDYAVSVGKPAVVNLSWGCSIGPHDGLSLFSQACDALTGPGKLFVCSAGNNGDTRLHVQKTFTATDSMVRSFVGFSTALPEKKTWVDIWGDSSKSFCVRLSLYNGANPVDSTTWICLDNQSHNVYMIGSNSDSLFATIVTSDDEFNGKPRIFMQLHSRVTEPVLISIKGNSGRVDMWSGIVVNTSGYYADFDHNGLMGMTAGNTDITIGDMASSKSALAVGAFCSQNKYTNISGTNISYTFYVTTGDLAPFSSMGPTRDGRIKPDIAAPGLVLGSAINSYDSSFMTGGDSYSSVVHQWTDPNNSRQYSYAMLMGTSMSSPAATGITALLLQINPSLTPTQLKDVLAETAIEDAYTGNLSAQGNNLWGHGKINAMAAASRTWSLTDIHSPAAARKLFTTYPNPTSEELTVSFSSGSGTEARVLVTDVNGRKHYSERVKNNLGQNTFNVPVKEWRAGIYFVTLFLNGEYQMQKFVVQ